MDSSPVTQLENSGRVLPSSQLSQKEKDLAALLSICPPELAKVLAPEICTSGLARLGLNKALFCSSSTEDDSFCNKHAPYPPKSSTSSCLLAKLFYLEEENIKLTVKNKERDFLIESLIQSLAITQTYLNKLTNDSNDNSKNLSVQLLRADKLDIALTKTKKQLKCAINRSRFLIVKEFLKEAEKHQGYAHGLYVREVILPSIQFKFKNCKRDIPIEIVFPTVASLEAFVVSMETNLKYLDDCDMERESTFCDEYDARVIYDQLGDLVEKVVFYVDVEYGWEDTTKGSKYIPSENRIDTSNSVTQYYSDCKRNIYRFTQSGFDKIVKGRGVALASIHHELRELRMYQKMIGDKLIEVHEVLPSGAEEKDYIVVGTDSKLYLKCVKA